MAKVIKVREKYDHYTIDLETMGNGPTSAIIAIGCACFSPDTHGIATFYTNVDLEDSMKQGLTVDASTIMWWMNQDVKARLALQGDRVPLKKALEMLAAFLRSHTSKRAVCWTHATFDAPILDNARRAVGVPMFTHYRAQRDIRTLVDMTSSLYGMEDDEFEGTPHNALDDAVHQARYIRGRLMAYYRAVRLA